MISFDVKSLSTNVRLHKTIEIILPNVYQEKKIKTSITKNIFKEFFHLCRKEVHFIFKAKMYIQSEEF